MMNNLTKKDPKIHCPSGNKIALLCSNIKCKNALRCTNQNCKDCGIKVHKLCASISLKELTYRVNERTEKWR